MTLYLRLLMLFMRWPLMRRTQDFFEPSSLTFLAWPWDCDFNCHVTNARYLSLMDLGRIHWTMKTHLLGKMLKKKYLGAVQATDLSFFRPIKPLQLFQLHTKLIYWDEKYFYFEQRFVSKHGLHAAMILRGVPFKKGKRVHPEKVFALLDNPPTQPDEPNLLKAWRGWMREKV